MLRIENGCLTDWRCDPIGSPNGNFVTGGVYRISGNTEVGNGAVLSWTLILKVVIADPKRDDPVHYNYWRREVMAYQSGALRRLPAQFIVPECYAVDEKDDGLVWLWLEDMKHEPRAWERNDYAYAAEKLGEFQAAYLHGQPLPEWPWVNRGWMRSWINECKNYRTMPRTEDWTAASERVYALLDPFRELEGSIVDWLAALDRLPKTFAHQDYYELNILWHADRCQERRIALIDWQFASISGIGEDLGRFLGLSVSVGQVPIDQFGEYRELLLSSYLKGMRDAGWRGDETLPRFGYLAAFALRSVWEVPKLLQKLAQDEHSSESLRLLQIAEYQLEAGIEAERLRKRLGL
ncbi:phosphotransferase [Paenibacillus sp. IB182493]|uniref:Phosphotransferase n=2 Tax=Paenibacillus arenilitoris TaxID=2772299 RepID=A0A927H600_9BACL|nr:phosphotransferase [Paenibacillus arenilitoris]